MVDPVSNEAISQVAQQSDVDDTASGSAPSSPTSTGEVSFQDVLDGKRTSTEKPERAASIDGATPTDDVERVTLHEVDDTRGPTGAGEQVQLAGFVEEISEDRAEIERMLDQTMHGADLDQRELLEMQTLIYSYSQKVELASKAVDKATGGLKQMMNVQV